VKTLYVNCHGALLIGVRTKSVFTHKTETLINPTDYSFVEGDQGYIITRDKRFADKLCNFKLT
jgi:hypothetical protein